MDLLALRYFQAVARLENMSKAASLLHVSQPAISKTIRNLESELNVKLFERRGKSIYLNEFGQRFLAKVDLALQALEDGKKELLDLSEHPAMTISIYIEVGSYLLPDIITRFKQHYPQTEFKLIQQHRDAIQYPMFDLCLSSSPISITGTDSVTLLTEKVMLGVPEEHRLAGKNRIQLIEAAEDGFISLKQGKALRDTTDLFCRAAGFVPQIIYECDEPSMVRSLVRSGLGVSFIPAVTWRGAQGDAVKLLEIEEPTCTRTIKLYWYTDRYMSNIVVAFKEFIIEYFKQIAT